MQHFKGDDLELKFEACASNILDLISIQKDMFYEDAYEAAPLGDILHEDNRSPLSNAISLPIFRDAFKQIFEAFVVSGSFESYLTVFAKIFGTGATVTFTVPAAGKLDIDIAADGVELSDFIERHIVGTDYQFNTIIEELSGDTIVFQTIKGFHSQYELEQMLFELVPDGIFTTITLTLG